MTFENPGLYPRVDGAKEKHIEDKGNAQPQVDQAGRGRGEAVLPLKHRAECGE